MAQLPDFYSKVNRVTWVVENIDKVRPAWEALGLREIERHVNIQLTGHYRGTPLTAHAWQITGRLGDLTIDMIQPGEGQANAYTRFLSKHGDGILSVVHEVPGKQALEKEIARMQSLGVAVLQQVTWQGTTYTYFDTEAKGKFVLGLVYREGGMPGASGSPLVTHLSPVIWDGAAVSAYWEKLGFPAFPMAPVTTGGDARYQGQPLTLSIAVGWQRHTQYGYEWISPPATPANVYADFLNRHRREGIQHIGLSVPDLTRAIADYAKLGYRVHQSGPYAQMDTDKLGGVSVELTERR
ncbi:MAG: VOC family protein [Bryobacteraceae bacterium]